MTERADCPDNRPVRSPCVSICLLDDKDICCGCYRSGDEIRRWIMLSDAQRLEILNKAHKRSRKDNPFA